MKNKNKQCLMWISEIQALAQSGLSYCNDNYDIERFEQLLRICAEMASLLTDANPNELHRMFTMEKCYATPRLDVRTFVLKNDEVLLVKERTDGLWSLPGGFIDVNESPSEAAIRETKEESGYDVCPTKLLAFWDKLKHDNSLSWPHLYTCIFQCDFVSGEPITETHEISAVKFFSIKALPPLSTPRITKTQILKLYELACAPSATVFD